MRVLFLATILCFISLSATASDICPMCDDYEVVQVEAAYEDALAKATYAYYHLKEVSWSQIYPQNSSRYYYWYNPLAFDVTYSDPEGALRDGYEHVLQVAKGVYDTLRTRNFLVRNATTVEAEMELAGAAGGCLLEGLPRIAAFVDYPDKNTGKDYGLAICPKLWNENKPIDVWGRVFIHELAHNFETGDHAYCNNGDCQELSGRNSPRNTDSFAWFAANDDYWPMESYEVGDRLIPGVPIKQIELEYLTEQRFRLEVPASASDVIVRLFPSASDSYGDADLYISDSGWPDVDSGDWEFRSWNWGNNEEIYFFVDEGTYYITVHAYDDFSEVGLIAEFQ